MDTSFIASFNGNTINEHVNPYFFFHIPKAAGMSLTTGLVSAFKNSKRLLDFDRGYIVCNLNNVDDERENKILSEINKQNEGINATVGGFFSSHFPQSILHKIGLKFRFITVLRENEDRVLSHYSYYCMRRGEMPCQRSFLDFVVNPENRNIATKTILGQVIEEGAGVIASQIIKDSFYAYSFIEDIDYLLGSILSTEGLPNLKLEQANKTLKRYRYEPTENDLKIIKKYNFEDHNLISNMKESPIKLPKVGNRKAINDKTVCVKSCQKESGLVSSSYLERTTNITF